MISARPKDRGSSFQDAEFIMPMASVDAETQRRPRSVPLEAPQASQTRSLRTLSTAGRVMQTNMCQSKFGRSLRQLAKASIAVDEEYGAKYTELEAKLLNMMTSLKQLRATFAEKETAWSVKEIEWGAKE